MSKSLLPALFVASTLFFFNSAYSQQAHLFENEPAASLNTDAGGIKFNAGSESVTPYRFHKKMPSTYSGYAIEVIASKYPLERDHPIFRQFGNIYYDKLREGGYSYLVKAEFSSDKAALHFLKTIILPKASDARLFVYKDGTRKVIREQ